MSLSPETVQRIRKELGLTQTALAKALGVSRDAVAKWESGARVIAEPTARLLLRLAKNHRKGARKTR